MTRLKKFLKRLMSGEADAGIRFKDLCGLLHKLEFNEHIHGDHHIFTRDGVEEILNLQPKGSNAKPYQVKQVRNIIRKYNLNVDGEL